MAFYADEEEIWKCLKHPSKRRRSGICPVCLRERLVTLCPDCANVRPCACGATTSSSSSASSSFSLFSSDSANHGSLGRVSNLIESEPALRRSRSVAIPFLRSRSRFVGGNRDTDSGDGSDPQRTSSREKTLALWSIFKFNKSKREDATGENGKKDQGIEENDAAAMRKTMMMKSRSVAVPMASDFDAREVRPPKGRSWYFPSPIKIFRQSKISRIVHEHSPLYRG